jgi:hypothetical protein
VSHAGGAALQPDSHGVKQCAERSGQGGLTAHELLTTYGWGTHCHNNSSKGKTQSETERHCAVESEKCAQRTGMVPRQGPATRMCVGTAMHECVNRALLQCTCPHTHTQLAHTHSNSSYSQALPAARVCTAAHTPQTAGRPTHPQGPDQQLLPVPTHTTRPICCHIGYQSLQKLQAHKLQPAHSAQGSRTCDAHQLVCDGTGMPGHQFSLLLLQSAHSLDNALHPPHHSHSHTREYGSHWLVAPATRHPTPQRPSRDLHKV